MTSQEPDQITIQHCLIAFKETPVETERSREDALTLAKHLFERAQNGEDFSELVREYSDDPSPEDHPQPGTYRLLNNGVEGRDFGMVISELNGRAAEKEEELKKALDDGKMEIDAAQAAMEAFVAELQAEAEKLQSSTPHPRAAMVPGFGDVGFSLGAGEVGLAEFDENKSPFGWHIIKRLD